MNPAAFAGGWVGTWNDYGGGSGEVDLTIEPLASGIRLLVKLTQSRFANWGADAQFVGGELVVDSPSLRMVLRLHGDDRLSAEYHNKTTGSRGTWTMAGKK
jgi:hypothetical protein